MRPGRGPYGGWAWLASSISGGLSITSSTLCDFRVGSAPPGAAISVNIVCELGNFTDNSHVPRPFGDRRPTLRARALSDLLVLGSGNVVSFENTQTTPA